ncbi:TetR family transcriptional regulator [Actinomyces sp. 2119]|uniref:TetR family transcriptional regulator n=1 Tax=Actinomyces lilanjuaniae TaxID=2321394 RepID=A0ABN5PL45_9ACTO|nr:MULTISPECIES: TetR/AcrR family transcriptional regulator [Actinomyces]AYD88917.1 TetR family transcriptional regulator [Actinomyces lilanjuaniae]RJF43762.1 TetR family transcriptional regulator [Actinomyces sp. 2119]
MTPARQQHATGTRQCLIDAALSLIDAHGWTEVTLTDVAHACDVTTPACYKYFPSKSSLFSAALHQLSRDLEERATTIVGDDPVESLLGIGTILVDLATGHPHLFEFSQLSPMAVEVHTEPASQHPLVSTIHNEVSRLATQEGADPEYLQLAIWSCLQGYARLVAAGAAAADPDFMRAVLRAVITIGDKS